MITLTVDGIAYQYPEEDDEDWGQAATLWAQSVTDILSSFRSPSSPQASIGNIRFGNADTFAWRNGDNDGNLFLFVDDDDKLIFSDGTNEIDLTANAAGNVTGPLLSTDRAIPRYSGTSGQLLLDSSVLLTDANSISGLVDLGMTGDLSGADNLSAVSLNLSGNIAAVVNVVMSGDLSGATSIDADAISISGSDLGDLFIAAEATPTDNAIVRWDGTTGTDVQNSIAVLSDAGALSGLTGIASSGTVLFTGTAELDSGNDSEFIVDANTGDAGIKLRLNNADANAWRLFGDNSADDDFALSYNAITGYSFDSTTTSPLRFHALNIAASSTPTANTLYANLIPKAWASCSATGTVNDGVNIALSSHTATGVYDYDFKTALANANYAVMVTGATAPQVFCRVTSRSTTGFTVDIEDSGGAINAPHMIIVMGDQAS